MASAKTEKSRAPSIRDVARVAGVSHQTVSRVLNNSDAIREATRDKVVAAMEQLQYRPNRAARALVTSRSRTIGVLTSQRSHYGPTLTLQAIEDAAVRRGYFVTTANIAAPDDASIRQGLGHLLDQDVEGIVVIAPQTRVFDVIAESGMQTPYVTLRSSIGEDPTALWVDQMTGARLATAHLLDLGHQYVRHIAGPRDWIEADARMQGFLREMSDRDMPVQPPILGDWTADFGYHAGRELLRWRDCTAIFCSNDAMALGVMHAARSYGLDVPGDLSVVGYDDIPEAQHFWPPLTTVSVDFAELGRRCVDLLLPVEGDLRPVDIVPRLVVRGSTGSPRSRS
ncbi:MULTISPECIES: LacI family DNA-binding transcriptional regulator [unclassified Curtobacterium]|uniref:LacI family DNA-binding transcriptional regulator n=1 Tax=unclassified Curtobacterium TaxID=257496 RepID=UPI000DA8D80F|nr:MULTISPECIES: LacI family DNA-binding transcriptional regulator [unclassified Curtobacterium]PZE27986.1 LacI family transcriptional regulator [Curtobacterium sp. MCBD17_028]PZE78252.1 LacI family transcriptional regulator [Curtobacterium sp. MCBD17_019]PZF62416.1 LacI family transcriptional regulator [Curtobacterium sp. MCBD17_034]PZF63723.1 LacI family transcriptional regulator [Curtobacterium sp. MCBD17_013]PZM39878.1 LacI family transcriptional regulator [Curtobacterium sp. MCBD17_031]